MDGFYLFKTNQNNQGTRREQRRGHPLHRQGRDLVQEQAIVVAPDNAIGETDPEPIHCRPFITGNPPCTWSAPTA